MKARPHHGKGGPRRPARILRVMLCGALLVTAGCGGQPQPPPRRPPEVTVATPVRRDVVQFGEFTGTTRAIEYAEIRARVSGTLQEIHFEPSSLVEEGQLLFTIEPDTYKAARDSAFAALKSVEAELTRAESELRRVKQAIRSKAVSELDRDMARAKRDQAEAAVLSARADLDKAELDFGYTEVRAPISGQVGRNLVDAGNLVGVGEPTLLTTINKMDPIYIYFDVPERLVLEHLRDLKDRAASARDRQERGPAYVATATDKGYPHEAVIDYVDNTVDPDTGTIQVRAVAPNADFVLFPGLFVRVRVPGPVIRDALLVEERAVGTDLNGKYIYVVGEKDVVETRYVELGPPQDDGLVAVLGGLTGDETYVVEGVLKARPGLPVTPQPRTAES